MRAFNHTLQFLLIIPIVLGMISSVIVIIPNIQDAKGNPDSLHDRYRTSVLEESVDERMRYDMNQFETELLLSAAGIIIALLFTNFVFGKFTYIDSLSYLSAVLSFAFALSSIWFGFRTLNQLKWLVMFEISSTYWRESLYWVYHLIQTSMLLYLAVPLFGIFILRVLNSKLPMSR